MEQETNNSSATQIWLVTISVDQFNWDSQTIIYGSADPPTIRWTGPGREIRENLLKAKEGDYVLCYRKDNVREEIVALGRIASPLLTEEYGDRGTSYAINIEVTLILSGPSGEQLSQVVPNWKEIAGNRSVIFSPISPEQWSYMRALLVHRNNYEPAMTALPPRDFPIVNRAEIAGIEMPSSMIAGSSATAIVRLRNAGNATWNHGEEFLISNRWVGSWVGRSDAGLSSQLKKKLDVAVPPGGVWEIEDINIVAPVAFSAKCEIEWVVEGEFDTADPAVGKSYVYIDMVAGHPYANEAESPVPPDPQQAGKFSSREREAQESPDDILELPEIFQKEEVVSVAQQPRPGSVITASDLDLITEPPPQPPPMVIFAAPRPEPPPADQKVSINVSPTTVTLEYKGKKYYSPNLIEPEKLLEVKTSSPVEYGETLFRSVINDQEMFGAANGNTVFRGFVSAINDAAKNKLRFELSLDPAALEGKSPIDLHEIWWEFLKDPKDDTPLALYSNSPFYRLQGSIHRPGVVKANRLKILVAICNPTTLGVNPEVEKLVALDTPQERDIMERALKRLKDAGLAEYKIWDGGSDKPVTLENLQQELEEGYHILHLIAHGEFVGKQKKFCLVMENDAREHDFVSAESFKKPLLTGDLRLVVLASCQSGHYSIGKAFQALGPRLADLGVPAVVAMQARAPIGMAQLFTQYFYDDLARWGRVDMAMAATRSALQTRYGEESQDWAIPILLMSTDDGRLFDVDEKKAGKLEELKPEIKTYSELPGDDPEPRQLAQAMAAEARNFGVDDNLIGRIRDVVEAMMSGTPVREEPRPIAEMQDRDALSEKIIAPVLIDPLELQEFVRKEGQKLEYPFSIFQQAAAALNTGKHLIFIGPPGTGKTTFAQEICRFAKLKMMTNDAMLATATADWSTFDTIGGYVPTSQQTLQFRPGIILRSICEGRWLVIDEINRAEIDKAFGELFTVLSGQRVDLPYWIGDQQVRILPAASTDLKRWRPAELAAKSYDYVIHPNWRIIAAMNSYDKSYLFAISLAFMRRFAFIDLGLPGKVGYEGLLQRWLDETAWQADAQKVDQLRDKLHELIDRNNGVMKRRALGPAILRDMIRHIGSRHHHDQAADLRSLLCEAFLLHAVPQFDGLERDGIFEVHQSLTEIFKDHEDDLRYVFERIYLLYPHIPHGDWPKK